MAFVPGDQVLDQDESTIQDPNETPLIPGVGGAAGASGQQGAPGGPVAAQDTQATQSPKEAGFVDVASYLSANRPQATQFSEDVAENLAQSAQQIKGTIGEAGQQYGQAVQERTVNLDEDLLQRALADPSAFVGNQQDFEALQSQRTAKYESPGQFGEQEFYGDVSKEIAEGQRLGQLGESEAGRRELLYSLGTNPTAGQVELDQLLLGGTPEAREKIRGASQQFYGEIPEYLQTETQKAQNLLNQAQQATQQTAQTVQQRLGASQTDLQNQIEQEVAARRADATQRTQNIQKVLENLRNYSPDAIRQLTLDPNRPYMPMIQPEGGGEGAFLNPEQFPELNYQAVQDLGLTRDQLIDMSNELYNLKYGGRWNPQASRVQDIMTASGPEQLYSFDWETLPPGVWPPPVTSNALYNRDIDLNQYLTPLAAENEITAAKVATPDQYADYLALAQLADTTPSYLLPGQEGMAGTAPELLARFDPEAMRQRTADALREQDIAAIRSGVRWIGEDPLEEFDQQWNYWAEPGGWLDRYGGKQDVLSRYYYGHGVGNAEAKARQQAIARAAWRLGKWQGPSMVENVRYGGGRQDIIATPERWAEPIPLPERFT